MALGKEHTVHVFLRECVCECVHACVSACVCMWAGEIERRREGRNREGGREGWGREFQSFREEQSVR